MSWARRLRLAFSCLLRLLLGFLRSNVVLVENGVCERTLGPEQAARWPSVDRCGDGRGSWGREESRLGLRVPSTAQRLLEAVRNVLIWAVSSNEAVAVERGRCGGRRWWW